MPGKRCQEDGWTDSPLSVFPKAVGSFCHVGHDTVCTLTEFFALQGFCTSYTLV